MDLRLVASTLALLFAPCAHASAPWSQPAPGDEQIEVEGISASDWSGIRGAYERARHSFFARDGGYAARSHGHSWSAYFDGQAVMIERDGADWSLGFTLERYGFEESPTELDTSLDIHVNGQRLEYDWDGNLAEWWINDTRGLEHGFTVRERPAKGPSSDEESQPLVFELSVQGGLHPVAAADRRSVRFQNEQGAAVLNYDGLVAFDADGAPLHAWMDASADGLRISVCEESACYPITIDPIFTAAYLKSFRTDAGDSFGISADISGDTVVVGAWGEDSGATGVNGDQTDNSAVDSGAAYVFVREGGTWAQQAYLKASNTWNRDYFGQTVGISRDTIVVGAFGEDSDATGINGDQSSDGAASSGAAYVFRRTGTTWSQEAYLKASNTDAGDRFGDKVAITGGTIIVASEHESSSATGVDGDQLDNSAGSAGAAYIFHRSGSTWRQQAYLKASNTDSSDYFGAAVALSGDTAVVSSLWEASGATGVNGDQSDNSLGIVGAVYVFHRTAGVWTQQAYLKPSN
ncbi:MAG: FG-GAP repeat protein, partial [Planctomycetota bacterium]